MPKYRILSFDTSTSAVHMSLREGDDVVAEKVAEPSGANRQETATLLLPGIDALLKDAGWKKSDLSCIVVGSGPGSFTGVRSAVVTARTIAQALHLPLIAVSLLQTLALAAGTPVAVILSGAKDHFFIAAYEPDTVEPRPIVEPAYVNLTTLKEQLQPVKRWVADEAARDYLKAHQAECEPLPVIKNIAAVQAQIGLNRLSLKAPVAPDGQVLSLSDEFPWSKVEPLYLRGASVTIKKVHGDPNKTHDPR